MAPTNWAVAGEQRSDGFGNVYYRLSTENDRIHRLPPSGVDEVIQLDSGGEDFAVSESGDLFQLGNDNRRQAWISQFDSSGAKVARTILRPQSDDTWISAVRLAHFSSGRFLVMGFQFTKDSSKVSPLIAIFDEDGFQVGEVDLRVPSGTQSVAAMGFFDAAALGAAALDYQGDHVYLVLPGIDKPLVTIEPSGQISNVLPIAAFKEGMKLASFRVKGDRVILALRGDRTLRDGQRAAAVVYKVFELQTRKLVASFYEENFIGDVVTFDGQEEFTSLASSNNRRYLTHVAGGERR